MFAVSIRQLFPLVVETVDLAIGGFKQDLEEPVLLPLGRHLVDPCSPSSLEFLHFVIV